MWISNFVLHHNVLLYVCVCSESDLDGERSTNADLMRRLTEFAQRLQTRNDSLTKVKQQSDDHIQSLSDQLAQARKVCS